MNKLKSYLKAHADKVGHFAAGSIVFTLAFILLSAIPQTAHFAPAAGILLSWTIAGVKEVRDAAEPEHNTLDRWDAYWTTAGGVFSFVILTGLYT